MHAKSSSDDHLRRRAALWWMTDAEIDAELEQVSARCQANAERSRRRRGSQSIGEALDATVKRAEPKTERESERASCRRGPRGPYGRRKSLVDFHLDKLDAG